MVRKAKVSSCFFMLILFSNKTLFMKSRLLPVNKEMLRTGASLQAVYISAGTQPGHHAHACFNRGFINIKCRSVYT